MKTQSRSGEVFTVFLVLCTMAVYGQTNLATGAAVSLTLFLLITRPQLPMMEIQLMLEYPFIGFNVFKSNNYESVRNSYSFIGPFCFLQTSGKERSGDE